MIHHLIHHARDTAKLIAAELAEIEENLIRRDLDAATRALLTSRRQEIIAKVDAASTPEGKDPWGKGVVSHRGTAPKNLKGGGRSGLAGPAPGSVRSLTATTGRSKSSVDRDLKRAKTLGSETLGKVAGTSLGTGPKLDALANYSIHTLRILRIAMPITAATAHAITRGTTQPIRNGL